MSKLALFASIFALSLDENMLIMEINQSMQLWMINTAYNNNNKYSVNSHLRLGSGRLSSISPLNPLEKAAVAIITYIVMNYSRHQIIMTQFKLRLALLLSPITISKKAFPRKPGNSTQWWYWLMVIVLWFYINMWSWKFSLWVCLCQEHWKVVVSRLGETYS